MKMVKDNTKTGLVFHHIRANGAQTIAEIEKSLGFDAYHVVWSMQKRGILVCTPGVGAVSRTGIFEILPKSVHIQENIKTPLSRKVYAKQNTLRITIPQDKKADSALMVLKYAVGRPKNGSKVTIQGKTQVDIVVDNAKLESITSILNKMRKDGFTVDASLMTTKVVKTLEAQFYL